MNVKLLELEFGTDWLEQAVFFFGRGLDFSSLARELERQARCASKLYRLAFTLLSLTLCS